MEKSPTHAVMKLLKARGWKARPNPNGNINVYRGTQFVAEVMITKDSAQVVTTIANALARRAREIAVFAAELWNAEWEYNKASAEFLDMPSTATEEALLEAIQNVRSVYNIHYHGTLDQGGY